MTLYRRSQLDYCMYIGVIEVYEKQPSSGKYIMEVSRDVYWDAEHDPFDIGYLFFLRA